MTKIRFISLAATIYFDQQIHREKSNRKRGSEGKIEWTFHPYLQLRNDTVFNYYLKKISAYPGVEPGTSCTQNENIASRPTGHMRLDIISQGC